MDVAIRILPFKRQEITKILLQEPLCEVVLLFSGQQ